MNSGLDTSLVPVEPPGRVWLYNTAAYALLHDVLEAATGRELAGYSRRVLFDPIGMTRTRWLPRTTEFTSATGGAARGLETSTRDMARFGLMVHARGEWKDEQVVPARYIRQSLRSSQEMNPSYGRLWWLNSHIVQLPVPAPTPRPGPLIPTAPDDLGWRSAPVDTGSTWFPASTWSSPAKATLAQSAAERTCPPSIPPCGN